MLFLPLNMRSTYCKRPRLTYSHSWQVFMQYVNSSTSCLKASYVYSWPNCSLVFKIYPFHLEVYHNFYIHDTDCFNWMTCWKLLIIEMEIIRLNGHLGLSLYHWWGNDLHSDRMVTESRAAVSRKETMLTLIGFFSSFSSFLVCFVLLSVCLRGGLHDNIASSVQITFLARAKLLVREFWC